ncbi:MAG: DUF4956 domain-containing protein [Lachnospiraceae bacterium]|nr:DUF4956 domain-containing protein [Lachnospiraceae bacterium]
MKEYLYEGLLNTTGSLTLGDVLINFAAACIISFLIYTSYRLAHIGTVYSKKFNVSLVMLTLITTLVMNVIGNNIALSLGMVGALSIVRFRTAIKDSRDTAYIFWAIAVGICCGVSDYLIAGVGTFVIFMFLVIFGVVKDNERIMVVLKMSSDMVDKVDNRMISLFEGKAILRVQNTLLQEKQAEAIYEISNTILKKSENKNGSFIKAISDLEGIQSVSMVRQDEEVNQ